MKLWDLGPNHTVLFCSVILGKKFDLYDHLIEFGRTAYVTQVKIIKVIWKDTALRGIMAGYAEGRSRDIYRIYMYNSREDVETRDVQWADWEPAPVIAKMPEIFNNTSDQENNEQAEDGIMEDNWIEFTWLDDSQPSQPSTAQKMTIQAQT